MLLSSIGGPAHIYYPFSAQLAKRLIPELTSFWLLALHPSKTTLLTSRRQATTVSDKTSALSVDFSIGKRSTVRKPLGACESDSTSGLGPPIPGQTTLGPIVAPRLPITGKPDKMISPAMACPQCPQRIPDPRNEIPRSYDGYASQPADLGFLSQSHCDFDFRGRQTHQTHQKTSPSTIEPLARLHSVPMQQAQLSESIAQVNAGIMGFGGSNRHYNLLDLGSYPVQSVVPWCNHPQPSDAVYQPCDETLLEPSRFEAAYNGSETILPSRYDSVLPLSAPEPVATLQQHPSRLNSSQITYHSDAIRPIHAQVWNDYRFNSFSSTCTPDCTHNQLPLSLEAPESQPHIPRPVSFRSACGPSTTAGHVAPSMQMPTEPSMDSVYDGRRKALYPEQYNTDQSSPSSMPESDMQAFSQTNLTEAFKK